MGISLHIYFSLLDHIVFRFLHESAFNPFLKFLHQLSQYYLTAQGRTTVITNFHLRLSFVYSNILGLYELSVCLSLFVSVRVFLRLVLLTMPEIFRPRNKKLRHLGMHSQSVQKCECERGVLSQASGSISPLAQLPSPSIVAAQAYASEYQIPTGREGDAWSWRGSLTQVRDIPRRHSTVVTLAVGATSSGNPSSSRTAPSSQNVPDFRFTDEQLQKSKTHLNTAGPKEASAVKISDAKYHSETSASLAPKHRVPFQYTHDRLQTWGHAYFGNIATADAFVNAVSLRRPSLVATKEQDGHKSPRSSDQVTIRARVLPKGVNESSS